MMVHLLPLLAGCIYALHLNHQGGDSCICLNWCGFMTVAKVLGCPPRQKNTVLHLCRSPAGQVARCEET
uniref:Putative secreted protein n=1 Tax=Anopheles marajoara TaxID=58244 RepID=A0A2M4CFG9_9DIPT